MVSKKKQPAVLKKKGKNVRFKPFIICLKTEKYKQKFTVSKKKKTACSFEKKRKKTRFKLFICLKTEK